MLVLDTWFVQLHPQENKKITHVVISLTINVTLPLILNIYLDCNNLIWTAVCLCLAAHGNRGRGAKGNPVYLPTHPPSGPAPRQNGTMLTVKLTTRFKPVTGDALPVWLYNNDFNYFGARLELPGTNHTSLLLNCQFTSHCILTILADNFFMKGSLYIALDSLLENCLH